jgi:hypothetical protein
MGAETHDASLEAGEQGLGAEPVITEPEFPIVWPHEVGSPRAWSRRISVGINARGIIHKLLDREGLRMDQSIMQAANGEGSEVLAVKYHFNEIIRDMGYSAPRQAFVSHEASEDERQEGVGESFADPDEQVICKPYFGSGGSGIIEMKAAELPSFLGGINRDYIVQERLPLQLEVRYVRQVVRGEERIYRVYDEKVIPKIHNESDRSRPKLGLILGSSLSANAKVSTLAVNRKSLGAMVPPGSSVHVSQSGVPPKDDLEWMPKHKHRVENMDRFMQQFMSDLQTYMGMELDLLCFDLAIVDITALDGEYDFERMKAAVMPLECQAGFGVSGYVSRSAAYRRRNINVQGGTYQA